MDLNQFQIKDWRTFYGNVKEELPPAVPPSKGKGFIIIAYVDADHADDSMTRRSRTGYILYLNNAPVFWMSKKRNSVEKSTFGFDFMAMKHCMEYIRGFCFRLRMMGIPCEDPAFVYGYNKSMLCNTTIPNSTLNKKSNSIAFHFVRECSAMDEWRTGYINTDLNPADLLSKLEKNGKSRRTKVRMILHYRY